MTRELFQIHKQNTKNYLNYMLKMSHYLNRPLIEECEDSYITNISTHKDATEAEVRRHLAQVQELLAKPNTTLRLVGDTKQSGRYDFFDSISYRFETEIVKETIEDYQVVESMRNLVKRHLGLREWAHLECKVMQLFKDGVIGWEQVVEAHKGDCNL